MPRPTPIVLALAFFTALFWGHPTAAAEPTSHWHLRALYLRSAMIEGDRADLTGFEIGWSRIGERWSIHLEVPFLSASGPAALSPIGSGYVIYQRRQGEGEAPAAALQGSGAGSGSPAEDSPGPSTPPYLLSDARRDGPGDVRLQLGRWLGEHRPWGHLGLRAGAKIPTASEEDGLGTGKADFWAGLGWRREGWTTDMEVWAEWVRLGDPEGLTLEDGLSGGAYLGWSLGRGRLRAGLEAGRAPLAGDPSWRSAVVEMLGPLGRRNTWGLEVSAGLSDTAPDLGVSLAVRY
jgi:hypothetical protein